MIAGKVIEVCSTYNHGRFLPAMIDAAFSAERPPDWLVVTDDASTDNSREILSRAAAANPRLLVRFNDHNRGALANVEAMLAEIDCDYVVLRSADDRDGRQLVAHAVTQLDAHPDAAFYGADAAYYVDDSGSLVPEPAGLPGPARFVTPDRFTGDFGGNMIHGAAVVFRLGALRAIGGFPAVLAWHSDWFTILRLAFTHGFVYEPITGAEIYLDSGSYNSTGTRSLERATAVYRAMLEILRREPVLRTRFREHAVFDLMGDRFRTFVATFENGAFADLCDRWTAPEIVAARRLIGIHAVVRDALRRHRAAITAASVLYVYGAGRHTEIMLECLTELGLRRPDAVIVTNPEGTKPLQGLPLIALSTCPRIDNVILLISSKSYEEEMRRLAAQALPHARILTVWSRCRS